MLNSDVDSIMYITIFVVSFIIGKFYLGDVKRKVFSIFFRPEEDDDEDERPRFGIKTA